MTKTLQQVNLIESRNSRFQDLTGKVFGDIKVLHLARIERRQAIWYCECLCGKKYHVRGCNLKYRGVKSCRSCSVIKHKGVLRKEPEYNVWSEMKQRCLNPKNKNYSHYGGRGIKIHNSWVDSYENFLSDMGRRPSNRYSIERIDVNGNYEPSNCKWIPKVDQPLNTTRIKKIFVPHLNKVFNTIKDASNELWLSRGYVSEMINGRKNNYLNITRLDK